MESTVEWEWFFAMANLLQAFTIKAVWFWMMVSFIGRGKPVLQVKNFPLLLKYLQLCYLSDLALSCYSLPDKCQMKINKRLESNTSCPRK